MIELPRAKGVWCDWLEKRVDRDPCQHGECAGCCLECNRELVKEVTRSLRNAGPERNGG